MAIIRDLPLADYLKSENIGNHQLKDFSKSPKLYHATYLEHRQALDVDDEEGDGGAQEKAKESKARMLGVAFEMFLDEPHVFDKTYRAHPVLDQDGTPFKTTKKYGKQWLEAVKAAGQTPISLRDLAMLREMKQGYLENPDAVELMKHCERQVTMTCAWPPQHGPDTAYVTLQSRPDYVSFTGCSLSMFRPFTMDLKTVDHMERMYTRRSMIEYGYDTQAEIARTTMRENGYGDTAHYILACEKSSPNRCVVFEVEADWLDARSGWVFNHCLDLAHCKAQDNWPRSRDVGIVIAQKPSWLKEDEGL